MSVKHVHEISISELQAMPCNTFERQDNSVRGCECVSKSQIKVGDKVVLNNYFTLVTEKKPLQVDNYRLNQLIEQGIVKDVIPLTKDSEYVAGKVYWNGYWHKYYTVNDAVYQKLDRYNHLKSVTVTWEDGRTGTHCTSLDIYRDYEIKL